MQRLRVVLLDDRTWDVAALLVGVLGFFILDLNRMRFVGGCDPASYWVQSLLFRGLDAGLALDPSIPIRGPLAPLCMSSLHDGTVVSFFPPGFPLILALTGSLGLAGHTMALCGALSAYCLFVLAKARAHPGVALGAMVLWISSPLVFFGGTQIMSDLPAALALLVVLVLVQRERWALSGLVFGASLGIRPTELLFAPALVLLAPGFRPRTRVALGGLAAGIGWAVFVRAYLGSWSLPYSSNLRELTGEVFRSQFWFLLRTIVELHWLVVALALDFLVRAPRRALPYALWFLAFLGFHSLWRTPFEVWWRARFLLPALPALFLLAVEGARLVSEFSALRSRAAHIAEVTAVAVAAGMGLFSSQSASFRHGARNDLYSVDALDVASMVPRDALVGAVNESAPLRLYGHVTSFLWCHNDTERLIAWALEVGRPSYAVLDDAERRCLTPGPELSLIERLPSGRRLFRIVPPLSTLEVGKPSAKPNLLEGFSGGEGGDDHAFVWVVGRRALLKLPESLPLSDTSVRILLTPFERVPQEVTILVASRTLGVFPLRPGQQVVDVVVPKNYLREPLELRFAAATAPADVGDSNDHRLLAAAVSRVTFYSVEHPDEGP